MWNDGFLVKSFCFMCVIKCLFVSYYFSMFGFVVIFLCNSLLMFNFDVCVIIGVIKYIINEVNVCIEMLRRVFS